MAYMATAIALAPILAPVIGGFLQAHFGWQSVFVVLSALGGLFFFGYFWSVPETNQMIDSTALNPARMRENYRDLLGNRQYLGHTMMVAILFWGMFAFITNSSFVLITELQVSPQRYGFCFGAVAVDSWSARFVCPPQRPPRQRAHHSGRQPDRSGRGFADDGPQIGRGIFCPEHCRPNVFVHLGRRDGAPASDGRRDCALSGKAGLASALMGFIQMCTAGLFVTLFGLLFSASSTPMVVAIASAGVFALIVRRVLLPYRKGNAILTLIWQ